MITVRPKESRITLLDNGNAANVFVSIAYQTKKVEMKPTEQLVITSAPRPVPTKQQLANGIRPVNHAQYRAHKSQADMGLMLERNFLLNCRVIRLANAWPYKRLDQRYGLALRSRTTVNIPRPSSVAVELLPIAMTSITLPDSWPSSRAVLTDAADGHYNLRSGSILIHATKAMTIDTPHGSIFLEEGPVVLISSQEKMTRVFNLHDQKKGSVTLLDQEKTMKLEIGHEAALMDGNQVDISRVILDDNIGHKDLKAIRVDEAHGMVTGEFSMGDMVVYQPLLQQLRKSKSKSDHDLVEKLIKSAAARQTMELGL